MQAGRVVPIDHAKVTASTSGRPFSGPGRNGEPLRIASVLNSPMTVSAAALSYASPTDPIDATRPASATVSVKRIDVYWAKSTGRRNTGLLWRG